MATSNITSTSEANEWVLACNPFEQCEIQSLKTDVSFMESELMPTEDTEINNMHFIKFEPRIFKGEGIDSLWVYINKKDILRKRPYTIDVNALLHDGYKNPIGSFKEAINVHDADVHSIPINEFFHEHTGVLTTLAVAITPQDRSITVNSVVGFAIGDRIQIEDGVIETTFPQIRDIIGNVITLDRPLDNAFDVDDIVEQVSINMNTDGSLVPVSYKIIPDLNQEWHIITITISLTHTSASDPSQFGDITDGLLNGVILRAYNGAAGQYRTLTNWKTNAQIGLDFGGVDYIPKAGGGDNSTFAVANIKFVSGAVPDLKGANGDFLEILIQDDLTSLITVNGKVQGHIVGL